MLRFYGYTPTALIYESHFISKWNQSHKSGSWEGRQQPLLRPGFRRWPWFGFFKFKRAPTPPPPFHHLDPFKWLLLLESCQRVQGWTGMWVSACQVENEIAVRRWRLNSVFNAWSVSEGVAQKKGGAQKWRWKLFTLARRPAWGASTCLNQHISVVTKVIYFRLPDSLFFSVSRKL